MDEVAERFDRYPNFVVDTAAEVVALKLQPREKVRNFLIKYQDRVLYGTDLEFMPWGNPDEVVRRWEAQNADDWRFFATDQTITYKGRKIRCLALPDSVLRKLYYENAVKWVPGIAGSR